MPHNHPRVPENREGDFYAIDDVCLTCGAPEAEAPDLIAHSTHGYGHCYFKRQPTTPEEIQHAINACAVSCVGGLKYGGKDEAILKLIYEQGHEDICDNTPIGDYPVIIWTYVQFVFAKGTMHELAEAIIKELKAVQPTLSTTVGYSRTNHSNAFEFEYFWGGEAGTLVKGDWNLNGQCSLSLETINGAHPNSLRWTAERLNIAMRCIPHISGILWFDQLGRMYDATEIH